MEASVDPHSWGPDWMPITLRGPHNGGSFLHAETHEELDNTIRTAVRRGILESKNGLLKMAVGSIEHYDRTHLKDQFLASLSGHRWVDRDDAIRAFARWMGFRRTGSSIDETARSLINGLLREGRIASDGGLIRRSGSTH